MERRQSNGKSAGYRPKNRRITKKTKSTYNGKKQIVQPSFFKVEQCKELQKQMHPI